MALPSLALDHLQINQVRSSFSLQAGGFIFNSIENF